MIASTQKIRICLVDDELPMLHMLEALIEVEDEFEICGIFDSGEEAMNQTDWENTEVLLTDLQMPGMSGIELISKAVAINPRLLPMVLTGYDDPETVFPALNAGAYGYLLKGAFEKSLKDSILQLVNGGAPMSPSIARLLITRFQMTEQLADCEPLTFREKEVMTLVADGFTYDEIGHHFSISRHTVHTHIKHLYGKLHAQSRTDALAKARALGYLPGV